MESAGFQVSLFALQKRIPFKREAQKVQTSTFPSFLWGTDCSDERTNGAGPQC